MADVMSEEQAEVEIGLYEEAFETKLEYEMRKVVAKRLRRGQLEYDDSKMEFTLHLLSPIQLENGKAIDRIVLREPTAEQLDRSTQGSTSMGQTIKLLSLISKEPVGVINRLAMRDLTACAAVIAFFG